MVWILIFLARIYWIQSSHHFCWAVGMCWGWRTSGCRAAELQGHPAQMATAPRMCHRSCGSVSFICCNPALCRALGLIRAIESSCQLLVTLRIFSDFRTGLGQPHLLLFLRTDITNSNLKHSSLRSYGFSAMPPFNKKKSPFYYFMLEKWKAGVKHLKW